MTDRIELRGLAVSGRHGVLPAERAAPQPFLIDAALTVDAGPAAASDDVRDTVDYAVLADRLAAVVTGESVALLETLADRLVQVCLADARVLQAEVTVHKPAAPMPLPVDDVAVTVRRARS